MKTMPLLTKERPFCRWHTVCANGSCKPMAIGAIKTDRLLCLLNYPQLKLRTRNRKRSWKTNSQSRLNRPPQPLQRCPRKNAKSSRHGQPESVRNLKRKQGISLTNSFARSDGKQTPRTCDMRRELALQRAGTWQSPNGRQIPSLAIRATPIMRFSSG